MEEIKLSFKINIALNQSDINWIEEELLRIREEIFFIGDGARWIHNLKESYFPDAIGVLDIWHLEREIKNALGDGKDFLVEVLKGLALRGNDIGIIKFLKGERLRTRDPRRFKKIWCYRICRE
jgi:hypothetical protein